MTLNMNEIDTTEKIWFDEKEPIEFVDRLYDVFPQKVFHSNSIYCGELTSMLKEAGGQDQIREWCKPIWRNSNSLSSMKVDIEKMSSIYHDFIIAIEKMLGDEFLKFASLIQPKETFDISVREIWFNYYEKGQYQETHMHLPHDSLSHNFSFNYVLQEGEDEDLCDLVLLNKNHSLTETLNKDIFETYAECQEKIFPMNTGNILIFPCDMMHYTTPHKGDLPRITVSGNLRILPNSMIENENDT
tara:strand:- start:3858 stop:4589 length:732 start_codon:yes stop_codon:yes gene_type:complete